MTSQEYYVSCILVTDKQTGESANYLQINSVFIMFIRSDHLGSCFLCCWQSTCDFMEIILMILVCQEQKDYGKIVREAT